MTVDEHLKDIAFITDHDARIDEIRLEAEGMCEIIFSHLEVYRPTELRGDEEEAYMSWIHAGRLLLRGVTLFSCEGTWETESRLMDGNIFDAAGARLRWERLLSEQVVKRVELDVFYGARIVIEAETALLRLEGEGEEFERWSGPL